MLRQQAHPMGCARRPGPLGRAEHDLAGLAAERSEVRLPLDRATGEAHARPRARVQTNGGPDGDNLGQYDGEVVWAIAPSPIQRGLLWAGTNDGKLWLTKDG